MSACEAVDHSLRWIRRAVATRTELGKRAGEIERAPLRRFRAIQSGAVMGLLPEFMSEGLERLTMPDTAPRELWLVVHEDVSQ